MGRKESITVEDILKCAFNMTREEGISKVTARKLAARAGCSTQPIFRVFENMEQLERNLFSNGVAFFEHFLEQFPKDSKVPFVNMGLAYIQFAVEEPHLFKMLFLSENLYQYSFYEILNGTKGNVGIEIAKAKMNGCENPQNMFMNMWIFIHGVASMAISGAYDLPQEETLQLLIKNYNVYKMS